MTSCHANDVGGAEGIEAVDEGDADLDFGGLAVGVSCRDALAEGFEAAHLRLDPASDVVSGPALPERLAGVVIRGDTTANLRDFSATFLTGIARIEGGAGDDTLIGSTGRDVLSGGAGRDVMTGGLGADTFVFASASDSVKATPDLITDFVSGVDHVDLSLIDANTLLTGDQAFAFISSALFSHTAGELRLAGGGVGFAQLVGDVNGDGQADFMLKFDLSTGQMSVVTDFIL